MVLSTADPERTAGSSTGGSSLKRLTIGIPLSISSLMAHCAKPKPKPKPKPTVPPPPTRHLRLHLYFNGDSPLLRCPKNLLSQITNKTSGGGGGGNHGSLPLVRQSKHLLSQISNKAITLVHGNKPNPSTSAAQDLDGGGNTATSRGGLLRSPVVVRHYSKKLLTQIGNKAVTLVQRSRSRKHETDQDEFGDGGVWQRSILMGDKCQPLAFSGVIYYDSHGKRLDDDNDLQLALRDAPSLHPCPTCGK